MLGDTTSVDCQYVSMFNTLSTQVLLIAFHMPAPNLFLHCQTSSDAAVGSRPDMQQAAATVKC